MKKFKSERDWKDLERADKVVIAVACLIWLAMSFGVFNQSQKIAQLKQKAAKTEMVKQVVKTELIRIQR